MLSGDKERIERASLFTMPVIGENFFIRGAKYEHPIAFNQGKIEGFNGGIETFITAVKSEFNDQNWDYLDFIKDRIVNEKLKKK